MADSKASRRRRPASRRLIQLYAALLHNAHLKGFLSGQIYQGKAKYACVPGLNCYSCPAAVGACPLGALQNALASAGHGAGWYAAGILLLFGVVLGRTVCGWLCPMGLIQELLHAIPTPKLRKSRFTRALTWLKYAVLAVFVIALPLGYGLRHGLPLPAFCKYICPAGTLEGAVGLLAVPMPANTGYFGMLGVLFTRKFVVMAAVGLACVFCCRAFCRFLCPLGAIYGLFNRFSVVGVKVDPGRCDGCGACVRGCAMDVRRVGGRECISCGQCMESCPHGAISLRAGKITLLAPERGCADDGPDAAQKRKKRGRVLRGAALVVLCLALLWFNALDPAVRDEPMPFSAPAEEPADAEPAAPEGREAGERLPDFALPCYDGTTFRLADQRGKIVFINLWATSCAPCKRELPYFSDLCKAHAGDIAVLVVHSSMVLDDPAAYLADKGYAMAFATDDAEDTVARLVGSTGTFPQTVVLNRRGEVVSNRVGSVTPETLEALFAEADGG